MRRVRVRLVERAVRLLFRNCDVERRLDEKRPLRFFLFFLSRCIPPSPLLQLECARGIGASENSVCLSLMCSRHPDCPSHRIDDTAIAFAIAGSREEKSGIIPFAYLVA